MDEWSRAATALLVLSLIVVPTNPFSDLSDPLMSGAWEAGDFTEPGFLYVDEPSDAIDDSQPSLSSISVRLYTPGASRVRVARSLRTDVAKSRALAAAARLHPSGMSNGRGLDPCTREHPSTVGDFERTCGRRAYALLCWNRPGAISRDSPACRFLEPGLAGDWRGIFGHKNEAGAVMVLMTFIGLFITGCIQQTAWFSRFSLRRGVLDRHPSKDFADPATPRVRRLVSRSSFLYAWPTVLLLPRPVGAIQCPRSSRHL